MATQASTCYGQGTLRLAIRRLTLREGGARNIRIVEHCRSLGL
jgi:hypothetical protein